MIRVFDNMISDDLVQLIESELRVASWKNTEWADPSRMDLLHMVTDLSGSDTAKTILDQITKKVLWLEGYVVRRSYANAHTMMDAPYPHVDSIRETDMTVLVYANGYWEPSFGGETVFFNHEGDIIKATIPKPGRVVVFNSNILHCARIQNKLAPNLRYTVAYKLEGRDV